VCAWRCLQQAWDGSSSNGQYDSLLTCMEAARARELPMSLERNLVMLHTMKPHYDPVKDGEGGLQAVFAAGIWAYASTQYSRLLYNLAQERRQHLGILHLQAVKAD
jgi:hypothetical protein